MPGSVTVEIASVVLSFPAYCALHPLLGADLGAAAAAILMCIGFPAAMIRLWKVYPPIPAVPVGPDDPVMSVCRERAMREFDRSKPGLAEGRKNAFVKYAVPTKGGGTERVRGHALALDGWDAIGSLVNERSKGWQTTRRTISGSGCRCLHWKTGCRLTETGVARAATHIRAWSRCTSGFTASFPGGACGIRRASWTCIRRSTFR
jgi:hypothetical protein